MQINTSDAWKGKWGEEMETAVHSKTEKKVARCATSRQLS